MEVKILDNKGPKTLHLPAITKTGTIIKIINKGGPIYLPYPAGYMVDNGETIILRSRLALSTVDERISYYWEKLDKIPDTV
jgi:hypothetical protein